MTYNELVTAVQDYCENTFPTVDMNTFIRQAEQRIYNTVQIANLRKNVTGSLTANNKYLSAPNDFLSAYSLAVYSTTVTTNTYTDGVSWTVCSLNSGLLIFYGASAELLAQISKIKYGDAVVVNGTAYVAAFPSGANAIVLTTPATEFGPVTTVTLTTTEDGAYTYLLNKDVNFIREAYPNPSDTGLPKYYAIFGPVLNDATELSFIVGPTPSANYGVELHFYYYPESIVTAGTTWLGDNFDSALLNGTMVEAIRFMKGEADMVKLYQDMYLQSIALLKNLGDGKQRMDAYRDGQVRVPVS
jgi:hypothetical protein